MQVITLTQQIQADCVVRVNAAPLVVTVPLDGVLQPIVALREKRKTDSALVHYKRVAIGFLPRWQRALRARTHAWPGLGACCIFA